MKKVTIIGLFVILLFTTFAQAQSLISKAHIKRENHYDVKFYFLDLDIEKASNNISGNVLISAKSLVNKLDTFSVELVSTLIIDSITASIDGGAFKKATVAKRSGREVNAVLSVIATLNQNVKVKIYYHGTAVVSSSFSSGFYGSGEKFSASPPYNSATWWPCKQSLTDKADSSWFYITTAAADKAVSNGTLAGTSTIGNKTTWKWKSKYPIDFYLISFVVTGGKLTTDYWHPKGRTDSLLLTYYGYVPSNIKTVLQTYSDLFGLYPFYKEKLGLVNVNFGGGMENQTVISLGASYGVEPHEIAHQWFGDNVTCGSYKDIMLNEGFAQWCESVYDEFTTTKDPNAARMSHFTDNTSTTTVYGSKMDTTTVIGVYLNSDIYYKKAAMVINTLRFHINNDSLFFLGLRNYMSQFGGKSALATDLKAVMEATTGISLTDFFAQWYYGGGAPTFNIAWNQEGNDLNLQINQTSNSTSNPLYKTPLEIKIKRTQGDTTVRLFVDKATVNFNFNCPGNITGFIVDPNQWLTNGAGKVTLDPTLSIQSLNKAINNYTLFPNPASSSISINGSVSRVNIKIYNLLGMLEYSDNNYIQGTSVSTTQLKQGIYFVHIIDQAQEKVIKLMIER